MPAVALFLAFFDWNLLKGPIESLASSALGRPVEIKGDIDVDPSLTPRVTTHDIRVGNPDWVDSPHMATLDRLEFSVRLPALLKDEVVLPELHFSKPKIALERNAQGQANWDVQPDQPKDESQGLPPIPRIGDVSVEGGRLSYRDPNSEVHLNMSSTQGEVTGMDIDMRAEGWLEGRPLNLNLTAGGLSGLRGKDTAYPVDARLQLGEATATVQGTIERPTEGRGFDIDIEAQGPDLADLDPLAVGISLAESPPFRLSGHLAGDVESPRLENPRLELGDNLLTGRIGLDRKGERPKLRADLSAPRLDVGERRAWSEPGRMAPGSRVALDMGGRRPYIDADLNSPRLELGELRDVFGTGGKDETPGKGLFPDQEYDFKKLRTLDADLSLRSRNINAPELRLQELQAEARLDRGKLVVRPFKVGVHGRVPGTGPCSGRCGAAGTQARRHGAGLSLRAGRGRAG